MLGITARRPVSRGAATASARPHARTNMAAMTAALGALWMPALQAAPASSSTVYPAWDGKPVTVRYATPEADAPLRSYTQASDMPMREGASQQVAYAEAAGLPLVRSGSLAFDALFALAASEMRQDAVSEIRDGSYNGGQAIPCDCFETGELWHYVWTRDLSYAASLGLAMLDPERVRNSLLFKLSGWRDGVTPGAQAAGSKDGLQIIQDTGSGGSWPVSTDRVSWAFGADEALKALAPAQRAAFAPVALRALSNTIENDRLAAYDAATGLYNGEQSFLDWREQSYAAWIADDLASMASSRALSTNVAHYKALTLAAQLAREQGQAALADKYAAWAARLKQAINTRLWLDDEGMYSSLTAGHFDGAPLHKFDWLGQSLAIVTGVADQRRARSILARYPHGPLGAPVIYPQQSGVAIYHNRAIWPFVTAYGLKAAALAANVSVADAAYDTLMRSAATSLSNMENLEWLSGQPLLRDGELSGPVVNSRRQLWSVGGYLGMVVGQVFGVSTTGSGLRLQPFITARLRRTAFAGSGRIELRQLRLRGKQVAVRVQLPVANPRDGYYAVEGITLNGKPAGADIAWDALGEDNVIEIRLGRLLPGLQEKRSVQARPLQEGSGVYAPREPRITQLKRGAYGLPTLRMEGGGKDIYYNIYRDGVLAAQRITSGAWSDRRGNGVCYAVEAVYRDSGNRSHHSAPACLDPGLQLAAAGEPAAGEPAAGGPAANGPLRDWGAPADVYTRENIAIARDGAYRIQFKYRNTAHQVNLGITGAVKWAALLDQQGTVVAQGVVQLPHSKADGAPAYSTPLSAMLKAGSYTLRLGDFYNMSYLQSNGSYADAGGVRGPSNRADLYGIRILPAPPVKAVGAAPAGP
ncbi:MGH1-like glycoside hydrolase domain-containing protein [Oxalobacteraceae bacterium A2-2]